MAPKPGAVPATTEPKKVVANRIESLPPEAAAEVPPVVTPPAEEPEVTPPAKEPPVVPVTPSAEEPAAEEPPVVNKGGGTVPVKRLNVYVKRAKTAEEALAVYKAKYGELPAGETPPPADDGGAGIDDIFGAKKPDAAAPGIPPASKKNEDFLNKFLDDPEAAINSLQKKRAPGEMSTVDAIGYVNTVNDIKDYVKNDEAAKKYWGGIANLDKHIAAKIVQHKLNEHYSPKEAILLGLELAQRDMHEDFQDKERANKGKLPDPDADKIIAGQNPKVKASGSSAVTGLTDAQKTVARRLGLTEADYQEELTRDQ